MSNKPEELLEFYRQLLNSLMLEVDDAGYISMRMGESNNPSTVRDEQGNERRLVLPTRDVLRRSQWDSEVAFHPLSENVCRGESDILKKLKRQILFRINYSFQQLFIELSGMAANVEYHSNLSPKQSYILDLLPKANEKTVDTFNRVFHKASIKEDSPYKLVNIYLKHGGTYRNEQYSRVAVTTFPVVDQSNESERSIFGVKFNSKRDYDAFWALFGYLFPHFNEPETYSAGSRSMEVPYLDALLSVYIKLAKSLNKVTYLFRKHLENSASLMIDVDWDTYLPTLTTFRGVIPSLEGNDGKPSIDEQKYVQSTGQPTPHPAENAIGQHLYEEAMTQPQMQHPQPHPSMVNPNQTPPWETQPQQPQQPAPSSDPSSDTISWSEVTNRQQPQQQQPMPPQPGYAPPGFAGTSYGAPYQQGIGPNQSFRTHPGMRYPQQQQQPMYQQPPAYNPYQPPQQPMYQQPPAYNPYQPPQQPPMGYQQPPIYPYG